MDNDYGANIGFMCAVTIVVAFVIAGLWDVACVIMDGPAEWYVSTYLTAWTRNFPPLLAMVCFTAGHLLWGVPRHR